MSSQPRRFLPRRRRVAPRLAAVLAAAATVAAASDPHRSFCGTSRADASAHCLERAPCPGGDDASCDAAAGHRCFADTACDARRSHLAFYAGAAGKMDRDDPRRRNSCGASWDDADGRCRAWCPDGTRASCPGGWACFRNTGCYYGDDPAPMAAPVSAVPPGPAPVPPSMTPSPSLPTVPSVAYSDPSNMRYCGTSWMLALATCSLETHCPSGSSDECPEGQSCYGGMMQCNAIDLRSTKDGTPLSPSVPASIVPGKDPRNHQFCGANWPAAKDACSLETHCLSGVCPNGLSCHGGIVCNASETLRSPTSGVTRSPTGNLILRPTEDNLQTWQAEDPALKNPKQINGPTILHTRIPTNPPVAIVHGLCASSFQHLQQSFHFAPKCTNLLPCDNSQICYPDLDVTLAAHSTIETGSSIPSMSPVATEQTLSLKHPSVPPDQTDGDTAYRGKTQAQKGTPSLIEHKYYCASSMKELELSCGEAAACGLSGGACPSGQACFRYNDCHENQPIVYGLCADSFQHLRQSFRFAPICSNVLPCDNGQMCYPDVDVNMVAQFTIEAGTSLPTMSPVAMEQTLSLKHTSAAPDQTGGGTAYREKTQAQKGTPSPTKHKYYCASSLKELESLCGEASTCGLSGGACPSGQTCFRYDDCHDNRPNPSRSRAEDEPDLCPSGFVGLRSPHGNCMQYYDCKDGLRGASLVCQEGKLFDNIRGECMPQQFINDMCEHIVEKWGQKESKSKQHDTNSLLEDQVEQQIDVSSEQTYPDNYLPDLCPLGFVGMRSLEGNCEQYFDCEDGLLENSHLCGAGFKFDNGQGRCISERLVDSKCNAFAVGSKNDQHQATHASEGDNYISKSASSSEDKAGDSELTGSGKENSSNLQSELAIEKKTAATPDSRQEQHQGSKLKNTQHVILLMPSIAPSHKTVAKSIPSLDVEDGASEEKATTRSPTPIPPEINSDESGLYWERKSWIKELGESKSRERFSAQICYRYWMLTTMTSVMLAMQLL